MGTVQDYFPPNGVTLRFSKPEIVPILVFTRIFDFIFSSWWYGLIPVHQWTSVSYMHCTAVCSCRISVRWMKFLWKQCSTAVCIVQFALCSVHCAVCIVQCGGGGKVREIKSRTLMCIGSSFKNLALIWESHQWVIFLKIGFHPPCIPYNHFPVQCPNFILMMLSTQH